MRVAFARTLSELADNDERIILMTGDLGYMALEPFSDKHPNRFINAGVSEQNMVGVATGLAEAGFIPFAYSIVTFASLRPYEFIRNGPILHQLPVRVVGIGGGVEYGHNGPSHLGLEDVGIMRVQPGITVVAPADHQQARTAILKTWDLPGPVYYRLGKDDKTVIPGLEGRFEPGRAETARAGSDVLIVTLGSIASEAVTAADILETQGISAQVMIVASLNPSPEDDLAEALSGFPACVTLEAHYVAGALGSLAAEVIAEHGLSCRLIRCGIRTSPDGLSGSQKYYFERHGLTGEQVAQTAIKALQEAR